MNATGRKQGKGAFTLTEMLVVVIVIGILAGITLPVLTRFRLLMLKSGTAYEIVQLDSACRAFQMDVGYFPPDRYSDTSSKGGGWNPYSGDWIPYLNNTVFLGVVPANAVFNSAATGSTPYGVANASQTTGWTSRCLVFFLGSKFTVFQKTYGPYYSFDPKQLLRIDKLPNATGTFEYPYGSASIYKTNVTIGSAARATPWQIEGIDIDPNSGKAIRSTHVYVYQYLDRYGLLKVNQPSNKNFYIYDCYNGIPPGAAAGGAIVNYIMHNVGDFDIFSYGADGISGWDDMPGSGTVNQAAIDAKKADTSTRIQFWLGCIGDDINNWGGSFNASRVH